MKKSIIIFLLLIWFMPLSLAGAEPCEVSGTQLGLECLSDRELGFESCRLGDAELSEIAGQGAKVSIPEGVERESAKIIFWDEAQSGMVKINLSTGYGNSQKNTLSIQGR